MEEAVVDKQDRGAPTRHLGAMWFSTPSWSGPLRGELCGMNLNPGPRMTTSIKKPLTVARGGCLAHMLMQPWEMLKEERAPFPRAALVCREAYLSLRPRHF